MDADLERSIRSALDSTLADSAAADVAQLLKGLGWADVEAEDPTTAAQLLYTAIGENLAPVAIIGDLARDVLGAADPAPGLLFARGGPHPLLAGCVADGEVRLDALGLADLKPTEPIAAVLQLDDDGLALWSGSVAPTISIAALDGWDSELTWTLVTGTVPAETGRLTPLDDDSYEAATAAVRRAAAQILVGCAGRMLRIAIDHVTSRYQFGRPIGSYQAVQHALADVHVAVTAAQRLAVTAWGSAAPSDGALALISASRAYAIAAAQAQQVCGGMGMSWEFPLHRYVVRGAAIDALAGDRAALTQSIGERLLDREHTS